MFKHTPLALALAAALAQPLATHAAEPGELQQIRNEIDRLKQSYESRISELESRLKQAERAAGDTPKPAAAAPAPEANSAANARRSGNSAFNPEVSLILSGTYANLRRDPETYRITGYTPSGDEIGPGKRGFSLGESELGLYANVDNLFYGGLTLALTPENEAEVEEAFVQTTALPYGTRIKTGRFFSAIGYQNSQHAHTWDFVDAPLAYQAFLGGQFAHDGLQFSWVAPTKTFLELGAEVGNGSKFPGNEVNRNGAGAQSVFAHIGGDLGISHSWRAGVSFLRTTPREREYETTDNLGGTVTNAFTGRSKVWIADAVWKWAPNGNTKGQNFKLQGEYFRRRESGNLTYDTDATASTDSYLSRQSGWYLQGVYQFLPSWRTGLRYDRLSAGSVGYASNGSNLDQGQYTPEKRSVMLDWNPTEFSRVRLQFARDKSRQDLADNQIFVQYQMSLGAHGAHSY